MHISHLLIKGLVLVCALISEYLHRASQLTSNTTKVPKLPFIFFFFCKEVLLLFFSSFCIDPSSSSHSAVCFISILPCFSGLSVNNPEELQSMVWKKIAEGSPELSSQGPKMPVFPAGNRENTSSSSNQLATLTSISYLLPFSRKGSSWLVLEKAEFNLCCIIMQEIFLLHYCFWESALGGKQSSFGTKWDVFMKQVSAFKVVWMETHLRKSLQTSHF